MTANDESGLGGVPSGRAGKDRPKAEPVGQTAKPLAHHAEYVGCLCAVVKVGGKPTGSRNWNPDCPVHPWTDALQAQADRAVEWQRRAREARKAAPPPNGRSKP